MRSAWRTVEKRWEMRIVVQWRVASRMRSKISASPRTSSCAVGSSRSTTPAPSCTAHSARANATRCHCPPDRSVPRSSPRASTVSSSARPAGGFERSQHLVVRRALGCDIVAQRQLEAGEILKDGGYPRPPAFEIEVANIDVIDLNGAGLRIVNAAQQLGERSLAGAVPADDGAGRSCLNREVESLEDWRSAITRVRKSHVAAADRPTGHPVGAPRA